MKLGIVGSNGFVGSNLLRYFSNIYNTVGITRNTVDILDCNSLRQYLSKEKFDCIIIAASTMQNDMSDINNNFGLMKNFLQNKDLFHKLINTGSGAELDRQRDLYLAPETDLFKVLPEDYYGLSQNLRSRLCVNNNFYNLRIFNCFGFGEIKTRIFPKILESDKPFTIVDDRYFDYFSIHDLCVVVEHFLTNDPSITDVNCVYETKLLISEVVKKFNDIHNLQKEILVQNRSPRNYTGDYKNLASLNLNLQGLESGLKNYFKQI